jgi:hypothetical protein
MLGFQAFNVRILTRRSSKAVKDEINQGLQIPRMQIQFSYYFAMPYQVFKNYSKDQRGIDWDQVSEVAAKQVSREVYKIQVEKKSISTQTRAKRDTVNSSHNP